MGEAYAQYVARDTKIRSDNSTTSSTNNGFTAQYGDEFLTKLISIGDQLSDAKFKQALLNQSLELQLEAEQITTQINRLQKNLDTMMTNSKQSDANVARVEQLVDHVSSRLETLGGTISRIAELRSQRALGQSGSLYDLNSVPRTESTFTSQRKGFIKFTGLGLLAGFFLGGFLALILAAVRKPNIA